MSTLPAEYITILGAFARLFSRRIWAHAPLLITAAERDNIIPSALNRSNYRRYKHAASVTDFHLFPNQDHSLIASARWQEVADVCLGWLEKQNI